MRILPSFHFIRGIEAAFNLTMTELQSASRDCQFRKRGPPLLGQTTSTFYLSTCNTSLLTNSFKWHTGVLIGSFMRYWMWTNMHRPTFHVRQSEACYQFLRGTYLVWALEISLAVQNYEIAGFYILALEFEKGHRIPIYWLITAALSRFETWPTQLGLTSRKSIAVAQASP